MKNGELNQIYQKILERPDNSGQAAKLTNDLSIIKCNKFCVDPLLFWKEKQYVYFQFKSGESLFWFPVTSALVERLFSKTGFILRPHRRCMQDDLAENSFYVKENINFLISFIRFMSKKISIF